MWHKALVLVKQLLCNPCKSRECNSLFTWTMELACKTPHKAPTQPVFLIKLTPSNKVIVQPISITDQWALFFFFNWVLQSQLTKVSFAHCTHMLLISLPTDQYIFHSILSRISSKRKLGVIIFRWTALFNESQLLKQPWAKEKALQTTQFSSNLEVTLKMFSLQNNLIVKCCSIILLVIFYNLAYTLQCSIFRSPIL